ncbi:rRNA processing protein [Cadophora sp. M221]|nr:rRNA processing protein [Cadophora sp. M221]
MGSSMRKKKEKKKDFQKPKLRVGKTKAKADNFTDTSFKAKSIVLNQQSLTTAAPSTITQLTHYLSLASSSKSDTQRKDAMSYLVTRLSNAPSDSPGLPASILLPKLLPLILDGSTAVRAQLIKLFKILPPMDVADRAESVILYTRAGMTHLATEIRDDALNVLEWLLDSTGDACVKCPGGWIKTLNSFMSMMGWTRDKSATSKWSSESKVTISNKANKSFARQLTLLAKFLKTGLDEEVILEKRSLNDIKFDPATYMLPTVHDPFGYLNLFGPPRDEDGTAYMDSDSRRRVFQKRFKEIVDKGAEDARRAGGETGRAGSTLAKVIREGMENFSSAI